MAKLHILAVVLLNCLFCHGYGGTLRRGQVDTQVHIDSESGVHNKNDKIFRQELENFQNTQYYGKLTVGEQTLKGIFDTGSFELLVLSTRCTSCTKTPYNRTLSNTYLKDGTIVKHVFGSGPVVSMQGYEEVDVGPHEAQKQCFWEILDHRISVLDHAKFAAIVGIGPTFAPSNEEKTLLMNIGVTEFSLCLERKSGAPGWLMWGAEDLNVKFATAPLVGELHWAVKLTDIGLLPRGEKKEGYVLSCGMGKKNKDGKEEKKDKDAKEEEAGGGGGCTAIVDSGTSLIAGPSEELLKLKDVVGHVHEDCSNMDELPVLHFKLNGHDFELPPAAYVMKITGAIMEADDVWDVLFFKPKIRAVNMCILAFMNLDGMTSDEGPVWILGMPFLRYYYSVFDREKKELKFALTSPDCKTAHDFDEEWIETRAAKAAKGTTLLSKDGKTSSALAVEIKADYSPTEVDFASLLPPSWHDDVKHKIKI